MQQVLLYTVFLFFFFFALLSHAFVPNALLNTKRVVRTQTIIFAETIAPVSFIDTELRGAAMRLHTKEQAPKEGQAPTKEKITSYTPTRDDYLQFLVDSKHVYETMEDIVNNNEELVVFRNCGLERTRALEKDIMYMVTEYNLIKPPVGKFGKDYATTLRTIKSIPEFVCHFYNFYFAHTAGGRMIGKQMSSLLLNDKKTLEFYKWDGDLNEIKNKVKQSIETMAKSWDNQQRNDCVNATAASFVGGGGINSYLMGGQNPH